MATTNTATAAKKVLHTVDLVPQGAVHGLAAASLAIALSPEDVKHLLGHEPTVKKALEILSRLIVQSKKSDKASGLTITVGADGKPEVHPLLRKERESTGREAADHEQAFANARARGRILAAEILGREDMLSAEQMADRLGISRVTVNARRQRHELLGLDGAKRGFRFPAWQVDEDGKPFDVLPQLFELLGPSPWGVYRFLTQRHEALDGATASDALRRGRTHAVLDAAESIARGDFA